ncbi:MAG: ABC transporter ATP-binding protein [Deltaproteobacteria bacterium]|nr:ABC transporter ATP-binding protein [Deltaproteobacteria bacterium]
MLKVRDLKKSFLTEGGAVQAVRGVSFEVQEGEFYTLLGPSGCGKTTTLNCIAGLERPDAGEIIIGGAVVYSSRDRIMILAHRRSIGMVFQSYAIWPHMTVFDNVAFPLVHGRQRMRKADVQERVRAALSLVRLEELGQRPAPFLSGGQQQRVALARALVQEPKLLLLDEPLSNLDAKLREEMRLELRQLVERLRITTIYVTHDQVESLSMSDRIALMLEGSMVQEGSPREIYRSPKGTFAAGFVGKINFMQGRVVQAGAEGGAGMVETPAGVLSCNALQSREGEEVLLAIRPENISIRREPSGQENNLEGVVEFAAFMGDSLECVVRVKGEMLRVKLNPTDEMVAQGTVYLHVPSQHCIVMPKTDERS